jgi:nucleoside-diphosphate-sugar epimerase
MSQVSSERVIVTGGAGLIGLHVVTKLLDDGHTVCVLDDFANSERDVVDKRAEIIQVDLTEHEKTVEAITSWKPQLIFHLACHPYEGLSQFNPTDVTMSTSIATLNVVTGAVRCGPGAVRRIVNYSSMARYGRGHEEQPQELGGSGNAPKGPPFMEWYKPAPEDVYGCAKVSAERSLEILCDLHNIEWCHVVPHNVYGEANGKALSDPYRGVLLIWTNCMLRNRPFFVYGDGMQKRAPSYVGDCTGPMVKMGFGDFHKEVVNIGSLKEYTLNDLADIAQQVFEEVTGRKPVPWERAEKRPCEVKDAWCSIEKSVQLLGYDDKTSVHEGMRRLIKWAAEKFPEGLEPRYLPKLEIEGDKVPAVWRDRKM